LTPFDFDAPIERRGTDSKKWSAYAPDVLPMWVADMDFAVPPAVIKSLRERLDHPVLAYAAPRDALREQIVGDMASKYDWPIEPDDIIFLPGVEPGFNMALRAFLSPGDGVVVQTPCYKPILSAPGHWSLQRIDVDLVAEGQGYAVDMDLMAAALRRARAFLFCHPHNPTGKVFDRSELRAMAELCEGSDALIISDEIHCELMFDGRRHVPMATISPETAARTITLMSASKTFNIAGLKTAFAIVQNPKLRDVFNACRLGMVDSVNLMGLDATLAAYRDGADWKQALIAYLETNRDYLAAEVSRRFPQIIHRKPEASFLSWFDCSALDLPTAPSTFFLEHGRVALSPGGDFGERFQNWTRLNFGCTRASLKDGLDRMERALASRNG
jgi:cystathionine beta-lyase